MAGRTGMCRAWVTPLLVLGFWLIPPIQAQTARNPHGPISIPCENCHTTTSFSPLRAQPEFDHNRTQFPLLGMHQNVACNSCHVSRRFYRGREAVRGLSRGFSQTPVRRSMRKLPHGARMAGCRAIGRGPLESLSAVGRSRGGGVRCLPSRSRDGRLYGAEHAMRHLPPAGVSEGQERGSPRRRISNHVRNLP